MMTEFEIVIVSPGLLEPVSTRGGGIEEVDHQIALSLSPRFYVSILGPFHNAFNGVVALGDRLAIRQVHFPAHREYPLSRKEMHFSTFVTKPMYSLVLGAKLCQIVAEPKRYLFIVHNSSAGLLAATLSKLTGNKVVYSEGNTHPWTNPYLMQPRKSLNQRLMFSLHLLSGRILLSISDSVRAQSDSIRAGMLLRGGDPAKIAVIPAAVLPLTIEPSVHNAGDSPRIGFVGRLCDEKGAPLLLEVVRRALVELPYVKFVILGDGEYRSAIADLTNVEHIGWVPRHELPSRLSNLDAVVFFQREGIGLAELQVMAAGKVIVCSSEGEMPQVVEHMKNGILCRPNAEDYVRAIELISNDPILRERIGMESRNTVLREFNLEKLGQKWLSLCSGVVQAEGSK